MNIFQRYKTQKNEDGSYDILSVPIFKLGKHRDFNYDQDWFDKTKANHENDEQNDYYPPVIIGHNDGKDEKPARGFLKNLQLSGENVLADIIKIPGKIFDQLKERAYPNRSVEVKPQAHKISALALLGGTEPYHKLPLLEIFGQDKEDSAILSFFLNDSNDLEWDKSISGEAQKDESLSLLQRIVGIFTDRLWQIIHSDKDIKTIKAKTTQVLAEGTESINAELNKISMEEKMGKQDEVKMFSEAEVDDVRAQAIQDGSAEYREKFKTQHGIYPEDYVLKASEAEEKARADAITSFCNSLKTRNFSDMAIAPAMIDDVISPFLKLKGNETIKFDDKDYSRDEAVHVVLEKIITAAAEDKLFVDLSEKSEFDDSTDSKTGFEQDDTIDPETLRIFKKAVKYQKDNKCSFEEAINNVVSGG